MTKKNIGSQIRELYKDHKIGGTNISESWWNTPKSVCKKFIEVFSGKGHTIIKYNENDDYMFQNIDESKKLVIIDNILYLFGASCELLGIINNLPDDELSYFNNDGMATRSHACVIDENDMSERYFISDILNAKKEYIYLEIDTKMNGSINYFFKFTDIPIIPVKGIEVLQVLKEFNILFEPICKIIALEYFGIMFDDHIDFIQKMNTCLLFN